MILCKECGQEIPEARLKIVPNTRTCVKCSTTGKVAGFPLITGKTTYSEIQIVDQETANELFQKQERKGRISKGIRPDDNTDRMND